MKLKTDRHFDCWAQFIEYRMKEPQNEEHTEAFLLEQYCLAVGIVYNIREQHQLSETAYDAFPLIENRDYSIERTVIWHEAFTQWMAALTDSERQAYFRHPFTWQ